MKKILTLLCVFATLPIGAIEHTPGAFRALQGIGLGFDGVRLITSLSQWGAEAGVVKLQKQVARLESALEKRKDSLTPRALERATRQITRAKKRLASRIKGLSANHRITMGLTAASEAAHVRNNWSEKGLGVLGAGLATAQLPPTRIGKHAWLKGLLGATDAGLGIARGLYYKNPRQMALFTAAQRATRLLHLLATYGLPGKNKRMIATYIAQALSLVAAGTGDPRENKTRNFNWDGTLHSADLREPEQLDQQVLMQLADPTLSIDRRNAMGNNTRQLRGELVLNGERTNLNNTLLYSPPLKNRLRAHFQVNPPDETELKGAMALKDDHGRYLVEQIAERGGVDWQRVYKAKSESIDTEYLQFVSQLTYNYPVQNDFSAEQLLAVHNDAIDPTVVENEVREELTQPVDMNSAVAQFKLTQAERAALTTKRSELYGDDPSEDQIREMMQVQLTDKEKQTVRSRVQAQLEAARRPSQEQVQERFQERIRARKRWNEAIMTNMVHEAMIKDFGDHTDANQIRSLPWSNAQIKNYRITLNRLEQDNDERKERATVEQLVNENVNHPTLRNLAIEKLIDAQLAAWLHAGTNEAKSDFASAAKSIISRRAADLPGISDGRLTAREKQRKNDKDELCPNCQQKLSNRDDIVSLGCQQCGVLLHAECFNDTAPMSCPNCRNADIDPRLIGRINPSSWASKLSVLSPNKQPRSIEAQGMPNRDLDDTQALWQVAERMLTAHDLQQIRNHPYPQQELVRRLRPVIGEPVIPY